MKRSTIHALLVAAAATTAFTPSTRSISTPPTTTTPPSTTTTSLNGFFGSSAPAFGGGATKTSSALIERAKDLVYNKSGFYSEYDADVFSEEFVFRGKHMTIYIYTYSINIQHKYTAQIYSI